MRQLCDIIMIIKLITCTDTCHKCADTMGLNLLLYDGCSNVYSSFLLGVWFLFANVKSQSYCLRAAEVLGGSGTSFGMAVDSGPVMGWESTHHSGPLTWPFLKTVHGIGSEQADRLALFVLSRICFFFFFLSFFNIYLAESGLSCDTRALHCGAWA